MKELIKVLKESDFLRIKLLGDSITHGVGGTGFCQDGEPIVQHFARNPNGFCWAKLLKEYLERNYDCNVMNNACTGTRIEFIIENFDALVDNDDDFVICMIGTNNRHQYLSTGDKKTPDELKLAFYNNILKLNELFVKNNKKVIFMANIPASAENEKDGADYWRILHMNDINDLYKKASAEKGFALISLYDLFSSYIKENDLSLDALLKDGLHPNDDGYKIMYQLLVKELEV